MSGLLIKIAVIGAAGIGAQWAAWRLRIPAIALLLIAGFLLGPVSGYLDPKGTFGELYKPMTGMAVAIILFEGGLTLNFKEIRETSKAVRRIVLIGGPLVWFLSALAAHHAAGLSWPAAIVLGAILVVTGPTVIMPLLRQAHLSKRPASLLRWEAIVNDPIGALFAVLAFETYLVLHGSHDASSLIGTVILAAIVAVGGGYVLGRSIAIAFIKGRVPEYLKAPVLLACVLSAFAISDALLEESGLLTVTIMGITLANTRLASLAELRRFKETVTVLLVSGLFIMLTASLEMGDLLALGWPTVLFVVLILFVIRPMAIFIATTGAGLKFKERLLVAWIAPRGIVAVAVAGVFGTALADLGVEDGNKMLAMTFAVVASTILLHGFSLAPMATWLGLKSTDRPGILIVGGTPWTEALSQKLKEIDVPTIIADSNWSHLRGPRQAGMPVFFGEVLSEQAHHDIAFNSFSHLIAATDNDSYNSLVCTEFGPEIGRGNVFQIGSTGEESGRQALNFTLGGRPLFNPGRDYESLASRFQENWIFHATKLTDEYGFDSYRKARAPDSAVILWVREDGTLIFRQGKGAPDPGSGDTILAFGPAQPQEKTGKAAAAARRTQT